MPTSNTSARATFTRLDLLHDRLRSDVGDLLDRGLAGETVDDLAPHLGVLVGDYIEDLARLLSDANRDAHRQESS